MFMKKNVVNVVKLTGVISSTGKNNLSLNNMKKKIDKAFSSKKCIAVALLINSPGGSAVQSEMIANYILLKSQETKIPTISFIEDVAASGGYWLALISDSVYALSKSSVVGSIGVLYASFGFDEIIKKHGVSRRVHTAGENKVILDPFQPEKEEDVETIKQLLAEIHNHFKDWVLQRRSQKLQITKEELFGGNFWVASQALGKGLVDEITPSMEDKLKELYGAKVKMNYIESKKGLLSSMISKVNIVDEVLAELNNVSSWNKFGL